MDENKHHTGRKADSRIIDLSPALEEKERSERAEEKRLAKAERPSMLRRILSLLLILVIVLGAVLVTIHWDRINFDALRRSISYIGARQDDSGTAAAFSYDRGSANCFLTLGSQLVFVSNKEAVIYDQSGKELFQTELKLESPALAVGGGTAVAYDIGGRTLVAFNEKNVLLDLSDEDSILYSATLNRSGWLAVTGQKKNQRGSVTIYNAEMKKVLEFDSSSRFVVSAYVTEDCKYMVAQTMGQSDGVFVSDMAVYRLDSQEQYGAFKLEDAMVLSMGSIGGQTLCIADQKAVLAAPGGTVSGTYTYELPYLREYSVSGDGFAVLNLNRHRSGSSGILVSLGSEAQPIAQIDVSDEILMLSAAGRYTAALYADRIVVYNKDLTEYASFPLTETAEAVCMRDDGSVWKITADEISLLIP